MLHTYKNYSKNNLQTNNLEVSRAHSSAISPVLDQCFRVTQVNTDSLNLFCHMSIQFNKEKKKKIKGKYVNYIGYTQNRQRKAAKLFQHTDFVVNGGSVAKSCLTLANHGLQPARLLTPRDFPGKNTGAVCHFLHQGIFLTLDQTQVS